MTAWGPFPTLAEVERHIARHEQPHLSGAPWMRRFVAFDGSADTGVEIVYLLAHAGCVWMRRPTSGIPYVATGREAAGEWRPIDGNGEAVDR